jgi:hypothetical protein
MKNLHLDGAHTSQTNVLRFDLMLPWNCIWYIDFAEYLPEARNIRSEDVNEEAEGRPLTSELDELSNRGAQS